jgi:uncharacterized membrane protein
MASDTKAPPPEVGAAPIREKGVRIFTYPKIIFIFPTLIMALVCWVGMMLIPSSDIADFYNHRIQVQQEKREKAKQGKTTEKDKAATPEVAAHEGHAGASPTAKKVEFRPFRRKENILGLIFLTVFFLNIIILAIDFPRFAILAIVLGGSTVTLLLLYIGVFYDILTPLVGVLEGVYVVANAEFFFLFSLVLLFMYGLIMMTRWLDYWEVLPNEILHHHGPLSDLERYSTTNLKFDKEIPDVFEHFLCGSGRLVIHVQGEHKAIVMENVLWVTHKEEALKKLMSRLEVRVTTDQEVASP